MANKSLSIIGRGTAGMLSVIYFLKHTEWDIFWIYHSGKEPLSVGEGTNLGVPIHLAESINFTHADLLKSNGTIKQGVYKQNWGAGSDFLHPFPNHVTGMHFSANELQEHLFDIIKNNNRVTIIDEQIHDPSSLTTDHVMVCSGWPETIDNTDYIASNDVPVNAAYIVQCYWDSPRFTYTISNAQEFGWLFAIPLQNRVSVGYLYNDQFSSLEDVKKDMANIVRSMNLNMSDENRHLTFNSFYKKANFSNKVIYNGNASFFLEPLEATSLGFSDRINRIALKLWQGQIDTEEAQHKYESELEIIHSFLCMHYMAGSIFDTAFWEYAKNLGVNRITKDIQDKTAFATQLYEALKAPLGAPILEEPTWIPWSYHVNVLGLGLDTELKRLFTRYWNE